MQSQDREGLHRFNFLSEMPYDRHVIQVTSLGDAGHQEVMLNDQAQGVGSGGIEPQPSRHPAGEPDTDLSMIAMAFFFTCIMEE
ncbi:hypothetical protein SDC9_206058 [bioreactor metagenome]|uniref:Uncharacterized protein n=1 Tax=bioreactor metagenome TaxID=1076179 RepID=A0A645JD65_9ZZZZ